MKEDVYLLLACCNTLFAEGRVRIEEQKARVLDDDR